MGLFKALHDAFFHTVSTKERNHFSKFRSMLISREGYAERAPPMWNGPVGLGAKRTLISFSIDIRLQID